MRPFFSIITCTRNSALTLAKTIDSVNAQTNKNYEHIFIDGGSTDGTLELIREMSPGSKILNDVVGGISRAMNSGIQAAIGDVFVHLHSDDFFADERALENIAPAFFDRSVIWVVGDHEYLSRGKRIIGSPIAPVSLQRLGLGNYIPHHSTFIRRSVFDTEPAFDETLKLCMDYDLWFRLFLIQDPVFVPKKISVFRAHEGSISTANRRATLHEELAVRLKYWKIKPQTLPRYFYRLVKRWFKNKLI